MELLARADLFRRERQVRLVTKSGLIVGLGETTDEILAVMDELRRVRCDVITIGQYLNPTRKHAPVLKFYTPAEFAELERVGLEKGFAHVESAPLVRSSYHAAAHVPPETGSGETTTDGRR
jgi:lipoic acid synthetase